MSVGTYISGAAHAGLIGWLIFGWGLSADPIPFEVTEVSIVSGEAFDAAMRAGVPDAAPETPPAPVVRDVPEPTPEAPVTEGVTATPQEAPAPAPTPQPEVAEPAPPEPTPAVPDPVPPVVANVQEVPPDAPVAPVPAPAPALTVENTPRPIPRPSQRIAPVPVAPTPDAQVADAVQQSAEPDAAATEQAQAEETTAPEEAAPEIVTEAEQPSGAPEVAQRPMARPPRPTPQPDTPEVAEAENTAPSPSAEPDETPDPATDAAVQAALEAALAGGTPQQGDPVGQNLAPETVGAFLGQIAQCWNMAAASTDAQQTTVTMAFDLNPDGTVTAGSFTRKGYTGGSEASAEVAYRVAEQAVTECATRGRSGYDLPPEKYDLWRQIELRFNPETMRLR